jgi:DNA-directed RNA polymerase specialized sigma24 family protein
MAALLNNDSNPPPTLQDRCQTGDGRSAADENAQIAIALARAIASGDREAEDRFVRRYTNGLSAVLRVHCQDAELCKDLVQDTLHVALVRLRAGRIAQPEAIAGFLRGIALNLLANELRRGHRRLVDRREDWVDAAVSESSDPYDTVSDDDLVRATREVIAGVRVERDRELLWRYYVDQDAKPVLCARFDLSPEHFDRVLHRARNRLKELWQRRSGLSSTA